MRFSLPSPFRRHLLVQSQEQMHPLAPAAHILISLCLGLLSIITLAVVLRTAEFFIAEKLIIETKAATIETPYQAKLLSTSGLNLSLKPEEAAVFNATFKNTGSVTWKNQGDRFLSVYTMDPKYRSSSFYDSSWRLPEQPTVMTDQNVPPGTAGTFTFRLRAPKALGTYQETFQLAAESRAWVIGGKFTITIAVVDTASSAPKKETATSVSSPVPSQPAPAPAPSATDGYSAAILLKSYRQEIFLDPNATTPITLGIKNSGTKTWESQTLRNAGVNIAAENVSFRHLSWTNTDEAIRQTKTVKPGELAFFTFTIQAPNQKGNYRPRFSLVTNDVVVPGGEIDIPVTVTADGPGSSEAAPPPASVLMPEPMLRIGLFKTDRPVMITADGDYDIYNGTDVFVETVSDGQPTKIIFDFNYHTATVNTPSGTKVLGNRVRLVAKNPNGVFTIPSYEHRTGWNTNLNDNQFRRALEVYYVADTGNLWIVNEVPMEFYLRGLAETSNYSPPEFQKALITAARTYAFYHFQRNTKHGGHFHVDATFDQVYRGFGNEIRTPTLSAAIDNTRGMLVTYDGNPVITPYYSRSDGRTRSWEEVWGGGPKPWLKSVPAPYDAGKTLWGHGVGMAASDAVGMANNNYLWDAILKHYYTGIELKRYWQ